MKECTTFEVEGSKKEEDLGKLVSKYVVEIVEKDMLKLDLKPSDAMDPGR